MEEKKLLILENVGKLYIKYGIRSVTMDDLARELGISKKTLYQYFVDKEDLVRQVFEHYQQSPKFCLNQNDSGNAIDGIFSLRSHVAKILKLFNNNLEFDLKKLYPGLFKKVHDFKRERILNETKENIKRGIETGFFRPNIDPEFIARLQLGQMLYTLNPDNEIFSESEVSALAFFDKVMDYYIHGICTPKGIEYYKEQLNKIQNEKTN